jgi:PadR family transcriptional regulator PadR
VLTYLQESQEGPPRKYYKITELGRQRSIDLIKEWKNFSGGVNKIVDRAVIDE